jgi:hypothetical protein
MNCPISEMIKADIIWAAIPATLLICLIFLDHWAWIIPASFFYIQFWSSIGDYRKHEEWHLA